MKSNVTITSFLFALLASTGCGNTQIVGRRVLEESAVRRELNNRPMEAKTCTDFFGGLRSLSDEQVQSRFEKGGFDAVLAWHRRPIIQMFEGFGKAAPEPLTLGRLLRAYRDRVFDRSDEAVRADERAELPIQDGRQTVEQGEVYFLDAHSDRPVWEGRGAVLGSTDAPAEIAADQLAKTAVRAFLSDGLIPKS